MMICGVPTPTPAKPAMMIHRQLQTVAIHIYIIIYVYSIAPNFSVFHGLVWNREIRHRKMF